VGRVHPPLWISGRRDIRQAGYQAGAAAAAAVEPPPEDDDDDDDDDDEDEDVLDAAVEPEEVLDESDVAAVAESLRASVRLSDRLSVR
jgi:hypothetical protein